MLKNGSSNEEEGETDDAGKLKAHRDRKNLRKEVIKEREAGRRFSADLYSHCSHL